MEMCYDGTLAMPSNCAFIAEEEMTYVDGGASFYLNADECGTITTYVNGILGVSATLLGLAALEKKLALAAGKIGLMLKGLLTSTLGIIGFIVGAIGVGALVANAVSFCVGCVTADRKETGVTMSWYGAAFGNFKYS